MKKILYLTVSLMGLIGFGYMGYRVKSRPLPDAKPQAKEPSINWGVKPTELFSTPKNTEKKQSINKPNWTLQGVLNNQGVIVRTKNGQNVVWRDQEVNGYTLRTVKNNQALFSKNEQTFTLSYVPDKNSNEESTRTQTKRPQTKTAQQQVGGGQTDSSPDRSGPKQPSGQASASDPPSPPTPSRSDEKQSQPSSTKNRPEANNTNGNPPVRPPQPSSAEPANRAANERGNKKRERTVPDEVANRVMQDPAEILDVVQFRLTDRKDSRGFLVQAKNKVGRKVIDEFGFKNGDLIVAIDGTDVEQPDDMLRLIDQLPGSFTVTVKRDGERTRVQYDGS